MIITGPPISTQQSSSRRWLRRLTAAAALPATLVGATLLSAPTALADVPAGPGSLTVHYSDGAVDWTVPTGTYEVALTAVGGSGSDGDDTDFLGGLPTGGTPGAGGKGATVTAGIPVVPGERLHLEPGSAALSAGNDPVHSNGGRSTGPFAPGGGGTIGLIDTGSGGGGGAATVVRSDSVLLAVAGGGGGGAGTGVARDGGTGGDAGSAGSTAPGAGGGLGGSGFLPAGPDPLGSGGDSHLSQAVLDGDAQAAGGGGGGGGGWDGSSRGGGIGGELGAGDAGGGGGAGGLSFAVDPAATIGVASSPGDGWVQIDWTPGVPTTQTLSAPDSADQGTAVTLTDTLVARRAGLPAPTGTVTFEQFDPASRARTALGSADVNDGQASLTTDLAGTGTQAVHAIYSGDGTYLPSVSDYVFTTVVATTTTLSISPSPVAFGNVATGKVATKTVTLTNTGTVDVALAFVRSDDAAVRFSSESCDALAAGASCTATVAFGPTAAGPVSATLTVAGDTGTTSFMVTGTGTVVAAKPVVTRISPNHGPKRGGTLVTITGRNFTGVKVIKIGWATMTSVTCSSSTTCTAITPRGTRTKAIRVITAAGMSPFTRADRFTYR